MFYKSGRKFNITIPLFSEKESTSDETKSFLMMIDMCILDNNFFVTFFPLTIKAPKKSPVSVWLNPNSLDNKGSCWILKYLYCSVTMLRELRLKGL